MTTPTPDVRAMRRSIEQLIGFRNATVAERDELAARVKRVRALVAGQHGAVDALDVLLALGDVHPAETRPAVVLDALNEGSESDG